MDGRPQDALAREADPSPRDWEGTARYEVRRLIGTGGMGVVYEALDRDRGVAVAIKTLLRFSPSALYRFKQEFRTLSDVTHPNLVRLYELVATDTDHVFFSMELVRGVDFLVSRLRASGRPSRAWAGRRPPATGSLAQGRAVDADRAPARSTPPRSTPRGRARPGDPPADVDLRPAARARAASSPG